MLSDMKKFISRSTKLYLILDRQVNTYHQLFEIAKKAVTNGVEMIQLRDKTGMARDILDFSQRILKMIQGRIFYIINDRVDLAIASGACGVHLGQDDVPLAKARNMMGPNALIGVSCQTFAQAQKAQAQGADYIGFGSVFKTLTKPDRSPMDVELLKEVLRNINIPVFAIGGINHKNVVGLKEVGVHRIAVCRAVCQAKDIGRAIHLLRA